MPPGAMSGYGRICDGVTGHARKGRRVAPLLFQDTGPPRFAGATQGMLSFLRRCANRGTTLGPRLRGGDVERMREPRSPAFAGATWRACANRGTPPSRGRRGENARTVEPRLRGGDVERMLSSPRTRGPSVFLRRRRCLPLRGTTVRPSAGPSACPPRAAAPAAAARRAAAPAVRSARPEPLGRRPAPTVQRAGPAGLPAAPTLPAAHCAA